MGPRSSRRSGFTLVEVLVAVAVMGVGASVFVLFFVSSQALAQSGRNTGIAASLAQEQLLNVSRNAAQFSWPLDGAAPGTLVELTPANAAAQAVTAPASLPVRPEAKAREENLYQSFSWQAYAKLPKSGANYVELTVAVRWKEAGRDQVFALSSCMPRSAVPAKSTGAAKGGA